MFKVSNVTDEQLKAVVSKFQEFGIGLVMTGYVSADAENATLWHELVYPNRITGNHTFNYKRIEQKYQVLFKKAAEVAELADAIEEGDSGPNIAFSVLDAYGRTIQVSWEELALFALAAKRARKKSDAFADAKTKARSAKDNIDKNLTAEEKRARDRQVLEDFEKEFGKDALTDL